MKLTKKQERAALAALRRFMRGPHWQAINERRSELIELEYQEGLTAGGVAELNAMQALASLRRDTLAPPPEPMRLLRRRRLPNAMMSQPVSSASALSPCCLAEAMRAAVAKMRGAYRDKRGTRAVRRHQSEATARALAACAAHARAKQENAQSERPS